MSSALTFGWLCERLDAVARADAGSRWRRSSAKREHLLALFADVRRAGGGASANTYDFVRLLLPEEDRARHYGLREAALCECYVKALQASDSLACALRAWKQPGAVDTGALRGDMADALSHALKERCSHSSRLSVLQVNQLLDDLSGVRGDASTVQIVRAVHSLDWREHKWFVRIVLKRMRLGVSIGGILSAVHPSAAALFGQTATLADVCRKCADPGYAHDGSDVAVLMPVRAMLARQSTIEKAAHTLATTGDHFLVEHKLVGERVMLHVRREPCAPPELLFLTRRHQDLTEAYANALASAIGKAMLPSVSSCILDGEMLAWDETLARHLPASQTRSNATAQSVARHASYFAFDLLLLNGRSLLELPLAQRKQQLREHVQSVEHRLEVVEGEILSPRARGETVAERLAARLGKAMELGFEGLVLKALSRSYEPGQRGWLKLKPDYDDGCVRTLDLLIVGGYHGSCTSGRHWRSNGISHFLLGVRAPAGTPIPPDSAHPAVFTIGKVGTGYSGDELKLMRDKLAPHAVSWKERPNPPHLCGWRPTKGDDRPDIWYAPERSLVVEVKAYDLSSAEIDAFRAGLALRFPRVVRVRYDKGFEDAATMDDVAQLFDELRRTGRTLSNAHFGAPTGGPARAADAGRTATKRPKLAQEVLGGKLPAAYAKGEYAVGSDLFVGAEVVALTTPADRRDEHLMLAAARGATLSINPSSTTRFVIVDAELLDGEERAREALRREGRELDSRAVELVGAARASRRDELDAASRAPGAGRSGDEKGEGTQRPRAHARPSVAFGSLNIVTAEWLEACAREGALVPIEPRYALHVSDTAAAAAAEVMDEWGDRFFEPASTDALRTSMRLVRRQRAPAPEARLLSDAHATLWRCGLADEEVARLDPPPSGALRWPRRCVALVPAEWAFGVQCSRCPLRGSLACCVAALKMLGALVVHAPAGTVSTVVLPQDGVAASRAARELRERFDALRGHGDLVQRVRYVHSAWVDACWRESSWVDEQAFELGNPCKGR